MEEYFESSMGMEKISESVALEAKPKLLKIGIWLAPSCVFVDQTNLDSSIRAK